jgi:hypothetical protein
MVLMDFTVDDSLRILMSSGGNFLLLYCRVHGLSMVSNNANGDVLGGLK